MSTQQESQKNQKRRSYSTEEKKDICNRAREAKIQGLDMSGVYAALADQYDAPSPNAIRALVSKWKKKDVVQKVDPVVRQSLPEQTSLDLVQRRQDVKRAESLVEAVSNLVEERDYYKREFERLSAEMIQIKKLLGI
ncbi:hypothetical protein D3C74_51120 [compost metagenome]